MSNRKERVVAETQAAMVKLAVGASILARWKTAQSYAFADFSADARMLSRFLGKRDVAPVFARAFGYTSIFHLPPVKVGLMARQHPLGVR